MKSAVRYFARRRTGHWHRPRSLAPFPSAERVRVTCGTRPLRRVDERLSAAVEALKRVRRHERIVRRQRYDRPELCSPWHSASSRR